MFLSVKIYTPLIYRKLITPRVLETPLSYSTSIYRKVGTIIQGSPQVIYIIITLEEGKKSRKKKMIIIRERISKAIKLRNKNARTLFFMLQDYSLCLSKY